MHNFLLSIVVVLLLVVSFYAFQILVLLLVGVAIYYALVVFGKVKRELKGDQCKQ